MLSALCPAASRFALPCRHWSASLFLTLLALSCGVTRSLAQSANIAVSNAGFETPSLGSGGGAYSYGPSGASWSFISGGGISGNASGFTSGNPNAPEGNQVAFIQGTGSLSQSLPAFQAGATYTLTVAAAQRGNNGTSTQAVQVNMDGAVLGTLTPSGTSYNDFTFSYTPKTSGSHTLQFAGTNPSGGDNTVFLDNVRFSAASQVTGLNLGFETPNLGSGSGAYTANPAGASWTFSNGGGISGNATAFTTGNPNAPEGSQVAFIQITGVISQSLTGFQAGTSYTLTVSAAQRGNYSTSTQAVQVSMDSTVIGTITPSGASYTDYTFSYAPQTSGAHTLKFLGLNPQGGDNTAFLDNVRFSAAATSPSPTQLPGLFPTGVDSSKNPLADGAADPHYTITAGPDGASNAAQVTLSNGFPIGGPYWLANTTSSKWVSPQANQSSGPEPPGAYVYRTTFDLTGFDLSSVQVTGQMLADDQVTDVQLNSVSLGLTAGSFNTWVPLSIKSGFQAGVNTLDFLVTNGGSSNNPSGLRVELSGTGNPGSGTPTGSGEVHYYPRASLAYRMAGGKFQGSNDGSIYTDLYPITTQPPDGQWSVAPLTVDPRSYRYLRYLAPDGAYGNIAELAFYTGTGASAVKLTGTPFGTPGSWNNQGNDFTKVFDGDVTTSFDAPDPGNGDYVGIDRGNQTGPAAPTALTATAGNASVFLSWAAPSGSGLMYNVKRATVSGGPYTTISSAGSVGAPLYTDTGVSSGTTYYYVVTAVTAARESDNSNQASVALSSAAIGQIIYDDALENGWQNFVSAALSPGTVNYSNASPVHSGTASIQVQFGPYQGIYLRHADFNSTPYGALTFWVNGGPSGGQQLVLRAVAGGSIGGGYELPLLPANTWQQVTVPLSSVAADNLPNLDGFCIQEAAGVTTPAFFIDDIALTSAVPLPQLTLTPAAVSAGYKLTMFAAHFPYDTPPWAGLGVGPLGIEFSGANVLVDDAYGNMRLFPDADGQDATQTSVTQKYGFNSAAGLAHLGGSLYMATNNQQSVVQINADGTFNQTLATGIVEPIGIVGNPATGHLFVATADSHCIYDVDPLAKTVATAATLWLSGLLHPDGLALSNDNKILYVGMEDPSGDIVGYDTTTKAVVWDYNQLNPGTPIAYTDGITLGSGTLAGQLIVNTNAGKVYQINLANGSAMLIASGGSRGDFVAADPGGSELLTQTDCVLRLTPPPGSSFSTLAIKSLSLSPPSVVGGYSSTATVTLTAAAPAGGQLLQLSSVGSPSATVPTTVKVPAGRMTVTFPVQTTSVTATATATISAAVNSTSKSASLTINPPSCIAAPLASLSLSALTVSVGQTVTGTVTLTGNALSGGEVVNLVCDTPAALNMPASVTVLANTNSATFTAAALPVTVSTPVNIGASYHNGGFTQPLTVVPVGGGGVGTAPGGGPGGLDTGGMTLTPLAIARGFQLHTFATFAKSVYPAGSAIISAGKVFVSWLPGNGMFILPSDQDGQDASSLSAIQNNAFGLATLDGNAIYMLPYIQGTQNIIDSLNQDGTNKATYPVPGFFDLCINPVNRHVITDALYDFDPNAPVSSTNPRFIAPDNGIGDSASSSYDYGDGVAVTPDGQYVFIASYLYNTPTGYRVADGAMIFPPSMVSLPGQAPYPFTTNGHVADGIAVSSGILANKIYTNNTDGTVTEYDINTGQQVLIASGGQRGDFAKVDQTNGTFLLSQGQYYSSVGNTSALPRLLRLIPPAGASFGAPAGKIVVTRDDYRHQYVPFSVTNPNLSAQSVKATDFDLVGFSGLLSQGNMQRAGQLAYTNDGTFDMQWGLTSAYSLGLSSLSGSQTSVNLAASDPYTYSVNWPVTGGLLTEMQNNLGSDYTAFLVDQVSSACGSYNIADQPPSLQYKNWPYQKNILTLLVSPNSAQVTIPAGRCLDMTAPGSDVPDDSAHWDILFGGAVVGSSGNPQGWDVEADHTLYQGLTVTVPSGAAASPASLPLGGYEVRFLAQQPGETSGSAGFSVVSTDTTSRAAILRPLTLSAVGVTGAATVIGTISLDAPAPAGGATITLTSTDPQNAAVGAPGYVTIPAGALSTTFQVAVQTVSVLEHVQILASYNGYRVASLKLRNAGGAVPQAPALIATGGDNAVYLAWSPVAGATSYALLRGTHHGGPYSPLFSGETRTQYADKKAANGKTYYYVATASNDYGTSPLSNEVSVSPSGGVVAAPTFSSNNSDPANLSAPSSIQAILSDATPLAVIHYTKDGSTPSYSSPVYSGPITLTASTTITAFAEKSGYQPSPLSSARYTVTQSVAIQVTSASCGGTASGTLSTGDGWSTVQGPGFYGHDYQFSGTAGTTVTLSVSAAPLDTVLFLMDSTGKVIASNDDGPNPPDPQIVFTLPATGTYTAEVSTYSPGATGAYSISLTCATGTSQTPPTVKLTAPTDGSQLVSGTNVTVSATATATSGTIASVTFYAGSTAIGQATSSPYSMVWPGAAPGQTVALTAVATDSNGLSATSAPVSVTFVAPPALSALASLVLTPDPVTGGQTVTGTVTLTGGAPSGGASVALTTTDSADAPVLVFITVPAGLTSTTFTIATTSVTSQTTATIGASYGGASATGTLIINPAGTSSGPILTSLQLVPDPVTGGQDVLGTVTLSAAAPTGGASVTLTTSDTAQTYSALPSPASVVVQQNATTATFTVKTKTVSSPQNVTISASYGGATAAGTLIINSGTATIPISCGQTITDSLTLNDGISINPAFAGGGTHYARRYTFTPTVSGNYIVTLTTASFDPALSLISAAGYTTPNSGQAVFGLTAGTPYAFEVSAYAPGQTGAFTLRLTCPQASGPAVLSVKNNGAAVANDPGLTGTAVSFGTTPQGVPLSQTFTLSNTGGTDLAISSVALTGDYTIVGMTPSLVPAGGQATLTLQFNATSQGTVLGSVVITNDSAVNPYQFRITATATAPGSLPTVISVTPSPAPVTGGSPQTETVTLSAAAPSGGLSVTLASSNAAVASVPAMVTFGPGQTTAQFKATTVSVSTATSVILTAKLGASSASATLNVNPSGTPPMITLGVGPSTTAVAPGSFTLTPTVTPAAGSTITKVEFFANGTKIGETAGTAFAWTNVPANSYTLTAKVTDSRGLTAPSNSISVTVTPASTLTAVISPNGGTFNAVQTVTLSAQDSNKAVVSGAQIYYTLDGNFWKLYNPNQPLTIVQTTTVTAKAVATGYANSLPVSATFTFNLVSDGSFSAQITSPVNSASPAANATISAPTAIQASISAASSWQLSYQLDGDSAWVPFALGSNSAAISQQTLATWDTTLLVNGLYQIQLAAVDGSGHQSTAQIEVLVQGGQKVGYFTLSYNDLTVPVAGFPLSITRTYDSRVKTLGDFGVGWTLSTNNIRLQKTGVSGYNWTQSKQGNNLYYSQVKPHLITITMPDGTTYNFQEGLADTGFSLFQLSDVNSTTVTYTAQRGTHATLRPVGYGTDVLLALDSSHPDDPNHSDPNGIELEDLDGNVYNPIEFVLTTRDGRQFDVTAHTPQQSGGLQWIRDLNGNMLTFSASGITSSSGSAITFQRTGSSNTITSISVSVAGQTGPAITYGLDGNGDLRSVTDRASNTSTYDYDPTHLLTAIHDPRGLTPLTNHYDGDGRLRYSTDASGNNILYNYSLTPGSTLPANTEATTDRLGNQTLLGYDDYGNVTSTTRYLKKADGTYHAISTSATYGYPYYPDNPDKKMQDIDALGRQTDYVYDTLGNLQTVTQYRTKGDLTSAITTITTYNSFGQPLTVTDPLGHVVSTNNYDAQGNLKWTQDALNNETDFSYNANGTLQSTKDAKSNVTNYGYNDPNNPANVTSVTDAQQHVTSFTYDGDGNKKTQTTTRLNAQGVTETLLTQFSYDGDDRLTMTVAPDQATSQTFYTSLGKVDYTLDALGRKTTYYYDNLGQMTGVTYPDGTSTGTTYDLNGQRTSSTDKAGRMSASIYDSLGRVVMSGPASAAGSADGTVPPTWLTNGTTALVSTTVYDDAGQVTSSKDALNHVSSSTYDNLGRTATSTDALLHKTQYVYDDDGRQLSVTDANLHTTSYDYDNAGRLKVTHYPDGISTSSTEYDELGRRISQTDQASHTTYYAYDTLGRLFTVTDPMNHVSYFGYDALGEKTSQQDANGHITYFSYDNRGRLLSKMLPGGQSDGRTYDTLGRLSTMTDFNGKMTTFAYDPASGRLMSKTASVGGTNTSESVSFTYNLLDGSRKSATRTPATGGGATVTTTYAYYGYDTNGNPTPDFRQGQLQSVTTQATGGPARTISYNYDLLGNKSSMTTPSGKTIGYAYDVLNRLQTVTHPDNAVTTFGYDKVGNRQSVSRATSATASPFSTTGYTYDTLNRLTDITNNNGSNALVSKYHYGLRLDGKRYVVTESGPATSGGTTNYTYDDQGKLTQEAGLYATIAYGYDNVGNRLTRTVTNAATGNGTTLVNGTTTNTYDQNDRIATVNGSATHNYDLDGNETTVNGQTAGYDFENHLVSLGSVANYVYDADGNRYSAASGGTTTSYVVDTSLAYASVVEEYTGTTLAARYDYGDDLVRMDRTLPTVSMSYYLYDGLGSTRQLVNTAGAVTDSYGYSAFGELASHTGSTTNLFLFNAQQFDGASGDYYLRARYYDQSNGRFISQDPYSGSNEDPVTLHRYLYAGDDPIDRVDPGGQEFSVVGALAVSTVVGIVSGAIVGGIEGGARGAFYGGLYGGIGGFIGAGLVLSGGIFVVAPALGVAEGVGVAYTGVAATAISTGIGIDQIVTAQTERQRVAAYVGLALTLATAGLGARSYYGRSAAEGFGSYANEDPNANEVDIKVGKFLANTLRADVTQLRSEGETPGGQQNARTADLRIKYDDRSLEIKNLTDTRTMNGVLQKIGKAQGDEVAILLKAGQFTADEINSIPGRYFSRPGTSKSGIRIIYDTGNGYKTGPYFQRE